MKTRVHHFCPVCKNEKLDRCFAVSKELWGWSDWCQKCDWRGQSPYWVDRWADVFDEMPDREPFIDWPNGQGE